MDVVKEESDEGAKTGENGQRQSVLDTRGRWKSPQPW